MGSSLSRDRTCCFDEWSAVVCCNFFNEFDFVQVCKGVEAEVQLFFHFHCRGLKKRNKKKHNKKQNEKNTLGHKNVSLQGSQKKTNKKNKKTREKIP